MTNKLRVIVVRVDVDHWEQQEQKMAPGSVIDTCVMCEGSIWLSPEGYRLAYEAHPDDSEIVCVDCQLRLRVEHG
jgi:hypothetical protein